MRRSGHGQGLRLLPEVLVIHYIACGFVVFLVRLVYRYLTVICIRRTGLDVLWRCRSNQILLLQALLRLWLSYYCLSCHLYYLSRHLLMRRWYERILTRHLLLSGFGIVRLKGSTVQRWAIVFQVHSFHRCPPVKYGPFLQVFLGHLHTAHGDGCIRDGIQSLLCFVRGLGRPLLPAPIRKPISTLRRLALLRCRTLALQLLANILSILNDLGLVRLPVFEVLCSEPRIRVVTPRGHARSHTDACVFAASSNRRYLCVGNELVPLLALLSPECVFQIHDLNHSSAAPILVILFMITWPRDDIRVDVLDLLVHELVF